MYKKKLDLSQCQICKESSKNISYLDVHHIKYRSEFKKEGKKIDHTKKNLVALCPACHRKVHIGEIIIDRWYKSTSGFLLGWHHKNSTKFNFS